MRLSEFVASADRLSMGPVCSEFESKFADWQGRKGAVLFNSGGSANLALLQALRNLGRLKAGDNVAFSGLTWSTNVMPIIQLGMNPVAVDVERKTINVMSCNLLDSLKTNDIKAFFITNTLGFTGDLENIRDICEKNGIIFLEDNCESLGTVLNAGKAGNFSCAATFSFFVSHHMSTIEGGMTCSDDQELLDMLRITRANGWARDLSQEKQRTIMDQHGIDKFKAAYSFFDLGFNLRPTEITGFLGLQQLKYIDDSLQIRNKNYLEVEKTIKANPDLIPVDRRHIKFTAPFCMPVICQSRELRDKYVGKFNKARIEIRPLVAGNIQNQPFYSKYVENMSELPGSDMLEDCGFYCGNFPEMSDSQIDIIIDSLQP
ncbi:MAG: DegT/DnrJ/EryC1/StrS family aminotransferase [Anaerohalosphaera sp.]|nr:DegT/DnrJ/EryC1/StrS family aminotransferase [Anaerohalosphaera sp.]